MKNILTYSKCPQPTFCFKKWKPIYFLQFYVLMLLCLMPLGGISKLVSYSFDIPNVSLIEMSYFRKVILGIIIAPVAEEFIFRLILKEDKKHFYLFGLVCLCYIFAGIYLNHLGTTIIIAVIFILGVLLGFYSYKGKIDIYSTNNYKYLYFVSILIFGLIHGYNYSFGSYYQILLIPLLTLPQMGMGFFLSYIRVNYGIIYSIAFHAMINLSILFT
ncbi:CPBP family glutamic-type intramembrane protease [Labilibaculum euxinus]